MLLKLRMIRIMLLKLWMHLYLTMRPTLLPRHPRLGLRFLRLFPCFLSSGGTSVLFRPRRCWHSSTTSTTPTTTIRTHRQRIRLHRQIIHHRGQSHQSKRTRHIMLIQIVHIVHIPKPMTGIRNQITPIRIPRQPQQPFRLIHMILNVSLNIRQLARWNLKLRHGNTRRVIILEKPLLSRIQKEEGASHPVGIAGDARHPQYVLGGIVGRFELHHPIHGGGNVEIPSRCVGRAQYPRIQIGEFEEVMYELFAALFAVHGEHSGHVKVAQELGVEFGTVGRGKEEDDLLVEVFFDKRIKEAEAEVFGAGDEGVVVGFVEGGVDGDYGLVVVDGVG
mmetsp:Transcript_24588/g.45203  ORF Transcript_24588/g.45203 Transcript_24588/m.45203 type:complete len:334 (-) Transcript_24588:1279-2280(-)